MVELYKPLPPRTIRLLRVLPGDTEAPIQCDLLLLPLPKSSGQMQLYEALSYVWGSEDKPCSILVSGHLVHIGTNLYLALLRLRHYVLDRVLWIDAICINQADTVEKSQQIPLMSQIYHQAGRVIVWLGEEADDSTLALDAIINANGNRSNNTRSRQQPSPSAQSHSSLDEPRMENGLEDRLFDEHDSSQSVSIYSASDDEVFHADTDSQQSVESSNPNVPQHIVDSEDDLHHWHMDNATQSAIFSVLTRPWFRRIWVLQEVSSSRYTLMVCGSAEVNGYAFCLGVLALSDLLKKRLDIFGWIMPVVNLMTASTLEPNRANLMPLGELVDMYHTRYSTMPHDMLYALQGLCSESFEDIGVLVDYSKRWDQVFYSFLRVLFPEASRFYVPADGHCAGIQHAAKIIGKVIAVENFAQRGGFQKTVIQRRTNTIDLYDNQTWHVPNSANFIQTGDFICLFEGNMRPAVVRAQRDYFEVVIVAASWEKHGMSKTDWQNVADFETKFDLLPFVWDWQHHGKVDREDYHQNLLRTVLDLNHLIDPRDISLARLKRLWDIAMATSPLSRPQRGIQDTEDSRLEAMEIHSKLYGFSPNDVHKLNGLPLLSWAVSHGFYRLAKDLLRDGADVNLADRDGRTALSYAAERGDVDLAQYFLENGAQRSCRSYDLSPLNLAMLYGDNKIAQVLLFLLDASKFVQGNTFIRAIQRGDIDVVRHLLSFGFDARSGLLRDIPPMNEVVTNLNIDLKSLFLERRTLLGGVLPGVSPGISHNRLLPCARHKNKCPLHVATETGDESMVRFLVEHCINAQGMDWVCPVFYAAREGKEDLIRLLPAPGAEADWRDERGGTPLHHVALSYYEWLAVDAAIVRILLDRGIDVNATDEQGQTPLMWAVSSRKLHLTKLLIQEGADVKRQDKDMQTCLVKAVMYRREGFWVEGVEILLENGARFEDTGWFYREARARGKTPGEMWPWCWPKTGTR